jgi:hypothetical protein
LGLLMAGCQPAPPADPNLSWRQGFAPAWQLAVFGSTELALEVLPDVVGVYRLPLSAVRATENWHVQFASPEHFPLTAGRRYRVSFRARADRPRRIWPAVAQAHDPWGNQGLYQEVALTAAWQRVALEFRALSDEPRARFYFDLGGEAVPLELADLTIETLP